MDLLLAAFPPELGPLRDAPPRGWATACTGVGALAAAAATARLIAERRPERVVFLGTCGRYDDRLGLFDCLWATEAIATSLEEVRGEAYRPEIERTRWVASLAGPLPGHVVAVPPAITRTLEGARTLAVMAPAEHLELTGVYAACDAAGVAFGGALVVVNEVGPNAQAQWKANHAEGSLRLIRALQASGFLAGA
ncbi:MAG TPA: phosphorylase [Holophagaceae bacterium]